MVIFEIMMTLAALLFFVILFGVKLESIEEGGSGIIISLEDNVVGSLFAGMLAPAQKVTKYLRKLLKGE